MPKQRPDKDQATPVLYRFATLTDQSGVDEETSSLKIVLATETPVATFDMERRSVVDEVLLMDGVEFPNQVPMLDSHNRSVSRGVLGSIRELAISAGQLIGRAFFSRRPEAQSIFRDMVDGHITDFSVGASRLEAIFIRDGETKVIRGKTFSGPLRVVTRAAVFEGSVVVKSADPNATVQTSRSAVLMRAYLEPETLKEELEMDELRKLLIERGMDEKLEGAEMLAWLGDAMTRAADPADDTAKTEDFAGVAEILRSLKPQEPAENPSDPVDTGELMKIERERVAGIDEICRSHGVEDQQRTDWLMGDKTVEQVAVEILKRKSEPGVPLGPGAEITRSAVDKFVDAASSALATQAIQGAGLNPHKALERAQAQNDFDSIQRAQELVDLVSKPSPESKDLRHAGLFEIARAYCEQSGLRITPGMSRSQIARTAISSSGMIHRADGPAYHTTGSFPQLMLDAANKTLLAAYDEAPVSYPIWTRTGPSASDFKQFNRVKFGELPDPEVVPENHPYPEKAPTDDREFAKVEKHGEIFSISLEAIINDDLSAISRIPAMQGNAMRRKINRSVYSVLTANAALRDGIALFHGTSHGANLDATALAAGAPLNVGYQVMMTQAGLNSSTILNIMPSYLIVPAALSATALQITGQNISAATVANTNLYGPGGPRPLTVVMDGQLDANSTTAWWLASSSSQVDTVEVVFLQGEESPVLSREDGFDTDTVKYKIRQSFVAFAVDYRGLYQGNS